METILIDDIVKEFDASLHTHDNIVGCGRYMPPFKECWVKFSDFSAFVQLHDYDSFRSELFPELMVEVFERLDYLNRKLGTDYESFAVAPSMIGDDKWHDYVSKWKQFENLLLFGSQSIPWFLTVIVFHGNTELCDFFLPMDKQGVLLHGKYGDYKWNGGPKDYVQSASLWILERVLFSLSFLNCSNVGVKEIKRKKKKCRHDVQGDKYYVLAVYPTKKVRYIEKNDMPLGKNKEKRPSLPFSVRRGHFGDYTKGKGLFGRTKGIFWFSETTTGSKENGKIKKDYRLKP